MISQTQEKLPVIIDNRGDNTGINALRRLCQLSETSCPANAQRLAVPPPALIQKNAETNDVAYHKIDKTAQQSRTLAAIRDALLPKLICGELRVPDAERIVKEKV